MIRTRLGRTYVTIALEWKLADLWVGAFWKRIGNATDLWLCVLPCLPIHVSWWPIQERDPFAEPAA